MLSSAWSMEYILRPSVHRFDNYSQAHSGQITHRWFDEWELEQITFAGDNSNILYLLIALCWQYFGNMHREEYVCCEYIFSVVS